MSNKEYLKEVILLDFNKKYANISDIYLNNLYSLQQFSAVKVDILLYPLERGINAESFRFSPYEDYFYDLAAKKMSAYQKITRFGDKLFGLILALFILTFFLFTNPSEIYSIESIVSMLAALAIGREIWRDIDNALTGITRYWRINWNLDEFSFIRKSYGNLERFAKFARFRRYKNNTILAKKMDFLENSNSKNLKLYFKTKQFKEFGEDSTRIASIHFDKNIETEARNNFMYVIHLTTIKKKFFFKINTEYFECSLNGKPGVISETNEFINKSIIVSKSIVIGKLKFNLKTRIKPSKEKLINLT